MLKFNKNKGFTLIEIIVAILVVTVGVLAAYVVTQKIVSYTHQISSRLTATYLAKDGIEIVRNIRDTNWLQGDNWDEGLGIGDWEANYNEPNLIDCSSPCDPSDSNNSPRFLQIGGGFYNYGSGSNTKFKRRIKISDVYGNNLTVTVSVWWKEKGNIYKRPITVREVLYNWDPF